MSNNYGYLEYRFDEDRARRAQELTVLSVDSEGVTLPDHHYMVLGGNQPHYITTKPSPDCDCHDFSWGHDRLCKHLIAGLWKEGDQHIGYIIDSLGKGETKPFSIMEVTILAG